MREGDEESVGVSVVGREDFGGGVLVGLIGEEGFLLGEKGKSTDILGEEDFFSEIFGKLTDTLGEEDFFGEIFLLKEKRLEGEGRTGGGEGREGGGGGVGRIGFRLRGS